MARVPSSVNSEVAMRMKSSPSRTKIVATPPVADASLLVGRTLARPLAAGAAARPGDLRPRQWFSAGETVRISARGPGFAVSGEAQALSNGIEGQSARLRTEGGRIVSGMPVGVRLVEVAL